jgi:hypothetical protein
LTQAELNALIICTQTGLMVMIYEQVLGENWADDWRKAQEYHMRLFREYAFRETVDQYKWAK